MSYKLLVLDIDGTVTNSGKEILEKTRKSIIRLQERGVRVVIASGRSPQGVFPIAEQLELHRFGSYILTFNGAEQNLILTWRWSTKSAICRWNIVQNSRQQFMILSEAAFLRVNRKI